MFLWLVQKRRSIRRFTERRVEPEKIDVLVEAALRSPSSRGLNPWQFIVVTERDLLARLSRAKVHGSSFLENAPLGIVICADPNKSDVWVEDASIASIFVHLAAESLGLGSCWIQIRKRMHDKTKTAEAFVREVLDIPESRQIESIVAVGYPDETKPAHSKEKLQYDKVYDNYHGKPFHNL